MVIINLLITICMPVTNDFNTTLSTQALQLLQALILFIGAACSEPMDIVQILTAFVTDATSIIVTGEYNIHQFKLHQGKLIIVMPNCRCKLLFDLSLGLEY
jgi:hypothetical protein